MLPIQSHTHIYARGKGVYVCIYVYTYVCAHLSLCGKLKVKYKTEQNYVERASALLRQQAPLSVNTLLAYIAHMYNVSLSLHVAQSLFIFV